MRASHPVIPSANSRRKTWHASLALVALVVVQVAWSASVAIRDITPAATVPLRGDHTQLSWREGPPYITNFRPEDASEARYSSDRRFLRLVTGHYAADFDTEKITLAGLAWHAAPIGDEAATKETLAGLALPPAALRLEIRVGDTIYACSGRRRLALDSRSQVSKPLDFPVRVIESGRFFQKFAVHDLEFRDPSGRLLPAAVRLEVAAWPDRFSLVLVGRPAQALPPARMFLHLRTASGAEEKIETAEDSWSPELDLRATLTMVAGVRHPLPTAPDDLEITVEPTDPSGRASVRWTPEENCHTIQLEALSWPEPAEGVYPEPMLDAWETYTVTLENRSDAARRVALNFDHTTIQSIICYVPMLLDAQGKPTGIPVQISKNWHQVAEGVELPYAGPWMHGRAWLNVPANSRVALRYGTTFARWGGLPTASLAQMSLVGWGNNGFWTQFALGAFGESFCFQPARTMRRALLADFRPIFQRGFAKGERWAWTGNVGGGDTMVRHDASGRYVPFKRNVVRYASHGPNLAHLVYDEVSADAAVRSHVEVLVPRTDDCVRVFLRVRYDVLRRAAFSRLTLFQLGADFYNEVDAPLIAWGNAAGLGAEHQPKLKNGERLLPTWDAHGEQPWISLHGEPRADAEHSGQASRGLIVREWQAVLGGKNVAAPHFAAVSSRVATPRLAAEIVAPPDLTTLEPGDRVDMLIEMLAMPLTAERYYGPDDALRAALATDANTWKMIHREARANRPVLQVEGGPAVPGWPLTLPIGTEREVSFTLRGGLGWTPLRLTGLASADATELFRATPAGRERVVQGDPARAFWQSEYDTATGRWTTTYNLPTTGQPSTYIAIPRAAPAP